MMKLLLYVPLALSVMFSACSNGSVPSQQQHYPDTVFLQDYSVKYYVEGESANLKRAYANRDGKIQILDANALRHLSNGEFLYPGTIVDDRTYRFMAAKNIVDMLLAQGQFVYLDADAVLSNAWSGRMYVLHQLETPTTFAANNRLDFLITDGTRLHLVQDESVAWKGALSGGGIRQVLNHPADDDLFYVLTAEAIHRFSVADRQFEPLFTGTALTAADVDANKGELIVGTTDGYFRLGLDNGEVRGEIQRKLPWTDITAVKVIGQDHWFGTARGAFVVKPEGRVDYYASERWLPGDEVLHLAPGREGSILVLTTAGLGEICFKPMTLHEKALYYEQQVRDRHIRLGFNSTLSGLVNGDLSTGYLSDSDNDGLWTSLYLAGQAFRYATTGEQQALDHCVESLDAMARLYDIHHVPGFPARSYERRGEGDTRTQLSDPERWQLAEHPDWYWKATTSSDEAIGHIFAFGVVAELVDHEPTRQKAIELIDTLMGHIVKNDLYLVDYDGQPTTWGRWNPEYVNGFPTSVGDRKLNSSNIIGMLQTAYHFTGKEIYKETAFDLMDNHGYLENLMRPMSEIGKAPEGADDWSQMLSSAWNHSDDEMYFAGYWGLFRYAFNDSLKAQFKASIIDHWEAERPEKEGAWNIFTAITGVAEFDMDEAAWYLREYPLDLIQWRVQNSHRKDIVPLPPNFRTQTIEEVLPPDELRITRHNANRFSLDGGSNSAENSAGDIWLFPYWMGRYLQVIGAPEGQP